VGLLGKAKIAKIAKLSWSIDLSHPLLEATSSTL
jgi:hypothetical protein